MKKYLKCMIVAGMILFSVTIFIPTYSTGIIAADYSSTEIKNKIDEIMAKYIEKSVPGGAVAIIKDGKILLSKGYGLADISSKKMVKPDETIFEYGSVNKLFVWVSAMQLVEKGELNLKENIKTYFPESVKSKLNDTRSITMLDLMNHTAGFEDNFFDFAKIEMEKLPPLEDIIETKQPAQIFKPHEIISYSNYGSELAAYVIKKISGEKFYDYERKHIFFPANMKKVAGHPLYKYNPDLINNKAKGYVQKENGEFEEMGWVYVPGYPAGGADGTVNSLANFALALTPESPKDSPFFTKKESYNELFSESYSLEKLDTAIAHGFWEYDGRITSYGHGGNTAGFSSFMSISPKERIGLIVLLNTGQETDLIYELQEFIYGKIDKSDFQGIDDPPSTELEGKYLPSRAPYTNFLELMSHLSAYEITSLGKGDIRLCIPGHHADYIQVSPYKYNIYDSSSLVIKYLYPELLFEKENGKIKRVTSGNSVDLIPENTYRSWLWVNLSVVILATGGLFFLLQPMMNVFYRFRTKAKISKLLILLNGIGLVLLLNNSLLLFNAFQYLYYSSDRIMPFIFINKAIFIASLILLLGMLLLRKKINLDKFNTRNILMYSFLLLIVLFTLHNWNFMKIF